MKKINKINNVTKSYKLRAGWTIEATEDLENIYDSDIINEVVQATLKTPEFDHTLTETFADISMMSSDQPPLRLSPVGREFFAEAGKWLFQQIPEEDTGNVWNDNPEDSCTTYEVETSKDFDLKPMVGKYDIPQPPTASEQQEYRKDWVECSDGYIRRYESLVGWVKDNPIEAGAMVIAKKLSNQIDEEIIADVIREADEKILANVIREAKAKVEEQYQETLLNRQAVAESYQMKSDRQCMDGTEPYDPNSLTEIFFSSPGHGRGSKVETLPEGEGRASCLDVPEQREGFARWSTVDIRGHQFI